MDRRKFLLGLGGASVGGSALIGSGAFTRVESQRKVDITVAEDAKAYLGLKPLDTPNSMNYVAYDGDGHLVIDVGDGGMRPGHEAHDNHGSGVNSDSRTWFDGMFDICNQGKDDVCVKWEFGDDFQMRDDAELMFYYDGDTDGDPSTEGRVDVEPGREVGLPLGQCATMGLRTETFDVDATAEGPLFEGTIELTADVDGDCSFPAEEGDQQDCTECSVDESDETADFLSIDSIDASNYPTLELEARVDTQAGRAGDLEDAFTVCEGGSGSGSAGQLSPDHTASFAEDESEGVADVMIVMDRSGSMSGSAMDNAKQGAKDLVDALGSGAEVGLVSFSSSASLDAELGSSSKSDVKTAIDALSAGGSTDMQDGISMAQNQLDTNGRQDAPDFMVVLGDGDVDSSDVSEADDAKDSGTTIYSIGYGGNVDEEYKDVASDPKEEFAFEADEEDISQVFQDIGGSISDTYVITCTACSAESGQSEVLLHVVDPTEGTSTDTASYTAP